MRAVCVVQSLMRLPFQMLPDAAVQMGGMSLSAHDSRLTRDAFDRPRIAKRRDCARLSPQKASETGHVVGTTVQCFTPCAPSSLGRHSHAVSAQGPLVCPQVLDDTRTLCLPNAERIKLDGRTMRMLFEVGDLAQASPATVSRCGMVYVAPQALGWRPSVKYGPFLLHALSSHVSGTASLVYVSSGRSSHAMHDTDLVVATSV